MEPGLNLIAFDRKLLISAFSNDRDELNRIMNEDMDRALTWSLGVTTDLMVRRAVSWLNLYRMKYSGPFTQCERTNFLRTAKKYVAQLQPLKRTPIHEISLEQLKYIICEEEGDIAQAYRHIWRIFSLFESPEIKMPGTRSELCSSRLECCELLCMSLSRSSAGLSAKD